MSRRRRLDPVRGVALRVIRQVTGEGAYANLALAGAREGLAPRDAAFVTELGSGTARLRGTYDRILAAASGRDPSRLDPALLDVLRLGCHQLLSMRVPDHAAVAATVELAGAAVGERTAGLTNAVLRRVAAHDLAGWLDQLAAGEDEFGRLATLTHHPRWIVEAWAQRLPADELPAALAADNVAPRVHLAVRPGLAEVAELGGEPARYSPFGAVTTGDPAALPAVAERRAGAQDEGSQLVALALSRVPAAPGPWLDLCAGPGGKAALLAGLAIADGSRLVAVELHPHRARLVADNLSGYAGPLAPVTVSADGTAPAWRPGSFARVIADVPCSGLGALRRRPEARWRHRPDDLPGLVALQRALLATAIASAAPGGVIAYVTCSPHPAETIDVVAGVDPALVEVLPAADYLPEVPDAADGPWVQLWPHRHGTDAMFLALFRRR
jgi:16S rRNA (cytosine967-C5)-methyltransferase